MSIIIDTGPLFALFDQKDRHHTWSISQLTTISDSLITCEAVLSETVFLMLRSNINADLLFQFIKRGDLAIQPVFTSIENQTRIHGLINTYANLPASFADACLVQMFDTTTHAQIFTLDSHFTIYRTQTGEPLSIISPG